MKAIAIEWKGGSPSGCVEVLNGRLAGLSITGGTGAADAGRFAFDRDGPCRLVVTLDAYSVALGSGATIVTLRLPGTPFSFFLRDVSERFPIFLPDCGVVVTEGGDARTYPQIADAIGQKGLQTSRGRMEHEPEEDFETAAAHTRPTTCPTWLGLSRDIRIFEVDFPRAHKGIISPRLHNTRVPMPDWDDQPVDYSFSLGRGVMCIHGNSRCLEAGVLPILHGTVPDDDVRYDVTAFVALENSPLSAATVRGTHHLVAYSHGIGCSFTDAQQKQLDELKDGELNREEEPVLFLRAEAVNTGQVPRYAWVQAAVPCHATDGWSSPRWTFEGETGFCSLENGNVFCLMLLNGRPLPQPELGILLEPGETATIEFRLPHRPFSRARAVQLAQSSFETRQAECRDFWMEKLTAGASVHLPEQRIDEMARAGILHLDLVAYGREPDGPLAACTGMYTPIGTESAPIIQFLDSMGRHDLARRALMFFLDLQREDGSMVAFGDYLVETGAVLWSIGEHFRYTRDEAWVERIAPQLLRSCNYLAAWRDRNKDEALRGRGYGMIDGQICDYPDPYRHFMLNGYACLGLGRVAELLAAVDPAQSGKLAREAAEWKQDIRASLHEAMARSPVVPLSDGTWCRTAPSWGEGTGPASLFADGIDWYSEERWKYYNRTGAHLSVTDALLGPQYLVFQEILDLDEPASEWLHAYQTDLFLRRNVAPDQPYYSRHPWMHLKRGDVKAFLKAFYNCMAAQADRETYTFPEGIHRSVTGIEKTSPHKTHEEGWFLMQLRWMLYMEAGNALRLLPGIPRRWLGDGNVIALERAATYFGPLSLRVESTERGNRICAQIECASDRPPACVTIRLPHPAGKCPQDVTGGRYDRPSESVTVAPFDARAEVVLRF